MPIYEYRCGTCSRRVEVLVRSGTNTPHCPYCGRPLTDKLFSVPNVLSGRTRRPAGHACCGEHEECDPLACSCEGECRHG